MYYTHISYTSMKIQILNTWLEVSSFDVQSSGMIILDVAPSAEILAWLVDHSLDVDISTTGGYIIEVMWSAITAIRHKQ